MRIALIGNSGSGKSTLAGQLRIALSLTALDLDTVAWEPGTIAVARTEQAATADVTAFCAAHDRWVVEGCYAGLVHHALEHSPILLFMDPGVDACLANCRDRPWEPHKYSSKDEQQETQFLLSSVRQYVSRDGDLSLTVHQELFDAYRGPKSGSRTAIGRGSMTSGLASRRACTIPAKESDARGTSGRGALVRPSLRRGRSAAATEERIRRLNESHGGVNSATDGYHETIRPCTSN